MRKVFLNLTRAITEQSVSRKYKDISEQQKLKGFLFVGVGLFGFLVGCWGIWGGGGGMVCGLFLISINLVQFQGCQKACPQIGYS